jgi:hypothetical protein
LAAALSTGLPDLQTSIPKEGRAETLGACHAHESFNAWTDLVPRKNSTGPLLSYGAFLNSVGETLRWELLGSITFNLLKDVHMSVGTILLIILVLLLIGALPTWGYSGGWGYGPSGILGLVLVVVLVLVLLGRF